jgi:hypothetical protein
MASALSEKGSDQETRKESSDHVPNPDVSRVETVRLYEDGKTNLIPMPSQDPNGMSCPNSNLLWSG